MTPDRPLLGTWVNSASAAVAELFAHSGFDFVTVDAEHSPVGRSEIFRLLQAIRAGSPDCLALVRIPAADPVLIRAVLDAGADGVICALINTQEEAERLVAATRYPPAGNRGLGFCRDNDFGREATARAKRPDSGKLVAVQIEHADALPHLESILGTPGVDAAFVGPYDLSASLEVPGDFDAPAFRNALADIEEACGRHDVALGKHVVRPDPEEVIAAFESGYRMVAFSLDITMLTAIVGDATDRIAASGTWRRPDVP